MSCAGVGASLAARLRGWIGRWTRRRRAASLVRQPPSAATLAWLVEELGASAVVEVSVMQGGVTAAMHRVTVVDRGGHERQVVLRRYVRAEILIESPDVAAVEARALQLVERVAVPTPACSPSTRGGDRADAPALVMTLLEGKPYGRRDRARTGFRKRSTRWSRSTMSMRHKPTLPPLKTYAQQRYDPPRWTSDPALWERAVELFHQPVPLSDVGFVHRDFNPATCCGCEAGSAELLIGSGRVSGLARLIPPIVGSTCSTTTRRWQTMFARCGSNDPD